MEGKRCNCPTSELASPTKVRNQFSVVSVHDREQESAGDQRIVFTHELPQAVVH